MKRKGFTLIELLAVIVVLAIIALIATPIVMNTIEKSKKGAAERSADNYIDAVETTVATKRLEGDILEGTYTINDKGNLEGNGLTEPLVIEMKGNKPTSGTITIKDGQVTIDSTMTIGDYDFVYNEDNKKYEATKKTTSSVEMLCKAVTTATTGNVPTGSFNYGDEYTCELGDNASKTFYVLETNGDKVSLIMNANIDSNGKAITSSDATDKGLVAWSEDGSSHKDEDATKQAVTAKAYLSSSTASWTKLKQSQISLPTREQIDKISNNNLPTWLYNYLIGTSNPVSISGYWLATPSERMENYADDVFQAGFVGNCQVDDSYTIGIRPVVTISKSQLN